jgi:(R,R)-butanediol dehydrogenase/meso-butanediol dehydrogenase/diacetyl reductase
MRAVVLSESRPELELVELPDPEPGPGEVVVRVTGCGICGSDLHVASAVAPTGMVFGHEIAGVVDALGPGVAADEVPAVGTMVAVRPFAGCGTCPACRRGRADHCDRFELLGMARPGGFAELTTVRADELYAVPAAVTGVEAALVEPLAIARRATNRAGLGPRDRVTILGGGPIGQAIAMWARHLGVEQLVVTDPSPSRRDLALRLGASRAIDPLADELAMLELALGGSDVVFECVGRPSMIGQAMDLAAVDGRVVVVGVCIHDDTFFPYTALNKELDVRFSIYYERSDFLDTISVLDRHGLQLDGFVEGTLGLDELPARFSALLAGADGGKLIVTP